MAITINAPVDDLCLSELVDITGFAEICGVKPESMHAYRRSTRTQYHVPEPAAYVGATPVWTRDQAIEWNARRPGQGSRQDRPDEASDQEVA